MDLFVTIIAFILIFSALVLVHEWGHFFMARRAGIKVDEFGMGLPPRAKGVFTDKKGTLYSLNWIPFGGFVKLHGEDSGDPEVLKDKGSYASKTLGQRMAVVVAGVVMNFALAWVLISVGFSIGMKPFLVSQADLDWAMEKGLFSSYSLAISELQSGSPLEALNLPKSAAIVQVNGQPVESFETLLSQLEPGKTVQLSVADEKGIATDYSVAANAEGKIGASLYFQPLFSSLQPIRYPIYQAPWEAAKEVARLSKLTVQMLGEVVKSLVSRFAVPEGVAGPVGIFRMTGQVAQRGIMDLVQFTALLSISLGVINIMPFPALDGGRFFFLIGEAIVRRRLNPRWEAAIHAAGFALLILFILVVTWNDIFG